MMISSLAASIANLYRITPTKRDDLAVDTLAAAKAMGDDIYWPAFLMLLAVKSRIIGTICFDNDILRILTRAFYARCHIYTL